MSIIVRALTSTLDEVLRCASLQHFLIVLVTEQEILLCLDMLKATHGGTGASISAKHQAFVVL